MIPLKIVPDSAPTAPTPVMPEEFKDPNAKGNLSKFEHDLYKEEDDVAEKVIRVKMVSMPNKGSKWKVMNNTTVIFTIESTKVSKAEREFLQTVSGFNFILAQAKIGIKSLNSFKTELKKILRKPAVIVKRKRGRPRKNAK
jgi:hypothetical protein